VATADAVIADFLVEDGLFSEAEAVLRTRLEKEPNQSTTLFNLAKLLIFQGRILEARKLVRRLEDSRPEASAKNRPALLRADYLKALVFAVLGDLDSLSALNGRLQNAGVTPLRMAFFEVLKTRTRGESITGAHIRMFRST